MERKDLIAMLSAVLGPEKAKTLGTTLTPMLSGGDLTLREKGGAGKLIAAIQQVTDDEEGTLKVLGEFKKFVHQQKKYGGKKEVLTSVAKAMKAAQGVADVRKDMASTWSPGRFMDELSSSAKKSPRVTLSPNLSKGMKMLGGAKSVAGMAAPMLLQAVLGWYLNRSLQGQQREQETQQQYRQIQQLTQPQGMDGMGGNPMLDAQLQMTQAALLQRQLGQPMPMKVSSEETI